MYDEIPLHVVESVLSLCYIRGTGETSVSHRPPELPANGECESPISIPDLEAELEAHGLLLVRLCFCELSLGNANICPRATEAGGFCLVSRGAVTAEAAHKRCLSPFCSTNPRDLYRVQVRSARKRGVMTAQKRSVWSRIVSTMDLSGHYDWVDQFHGRSSSILFAG